MAEATVKSYQRKTQSGQVVTVRSYQRTENDAIAEAVGTDPTRPAISAKRGTFPGGRSIPGIFPTLPDVGGLEQDLENQKVDTVKATSLATDILSELDAEEDNPELDKLKAVLKGISSSAPEEMQLTSGYDDTIIQLASAVKIKAHRRTLKSGKVVNVKMYTQLRDLISALGGPSMAARRGVTQDLVSKALPDYDMREIFSPLQSLSGKPTKRVTKAAVRDKKPGDKVRVQIDMPNGVGSFFTDYEKQSDGSWKSLDPEGKDIDFPNDEALLRPLTGKSIREYPEADIEAEKPTQDAPKGVKDIQPGDSVEVDGERYDKDKDTGLWRGKKTPVPVDDDEMDTKIAKGKPVTPVEKVPEPVVKSPEDTYKELPVGTKIVSESDKNKFVLKVADNEWKRSSSLTSLASDTQNLPDAAMGSFVKHILGDHSIEERELEDKKVYGSTLQTGIGVRVKATSEVKQEIANRIRESSKATLNYFPDTLASALKIEAGGPDAPKGTTMAHVRTYPERLALGGTVGESLEFPEMFINKSYLNPARLEASFNLMQKTKYMVETPKLTPMEALLAHESGHYGEIALWWYAPKDITDKMYSRIHDALDATVFNNKELNMDGLSGRGRKTLRLKLSRFSSEKSTEWRDAWKEHLSSYGGTNAAEVIAESWAEYVGNDHPRPLAKGIGEALSDAMEEFDTWMKSKGITNVRDIPESMRDQDIEGIRTYKGFFDKKTRTTSDLKGSADVGAIASIRRGDPDERTLTKSLNESVFDGGKTRNTVEGTDWGGSSVTTVHTNPDGSPSMESFWSLEDGNVDFHEIRVRDQGKGLGSKYVDHLEDLWRAAGVHKVSLHATDEVGGYFWARKGYEFDPENMVPGDVGRILDAVEDIDPSVDVSSMRAMVDQEEFPSPADIAALPNGAGRAALLNSPWFGVKVLNSRESDFDDIDLGDDFDFPEEMYMKAMSHSDLIGSSLQGLLGNTDSEEARKELSNNITSLVDSQLEEYGLSVTPRVFSKVNGVSYEGDIYNTDNQLVGSYYRTFDVESGTVTHDEMRLPAEAQGKGVAQNINNAMEQAYAQAGINKINLHAYSNGEEYAGGYVWARAGYDWNSSEMDLGYFGDNWVVEARASIEPFIDQVYAHYESNPPEDLDARVNAIRNSLYDQVEEMHDSFFGLSLGDDATNTATPFELSEIGHSVAAELGLDSWPGRDVMMRTEWHGTRDITDETAERQQRLQQLKQLREALENQPPEGFDKWYAQLNEWRNTLTRGDSDGWVSSAELSKALEQINNTSVPAPPDPPVDLDDVDIPEGEE